MKKSKLSVVHDISIGRKLWILNVAGVFIPVFLLVILFFSQIYTEYKEREAILIDESVNRVVRNFNSIFDSASDITYSYLSDKYISDILNNSTIETAYDSLVRFHDVEGRIQADVNAYDFIDDITIYHNNEEIEYTGHTEYIQEESLEEWAKSFLNSNESQRVRVDYLSEDVDIYFLRKLNAFSTDNNFVEVKLNNEMIVNQFFDESLLKYEAVIYIVDKNNQVMLTNINNSKGTAKRDISDLRKKDNHDFITMDLNPNYEMSGWKILVSYNNAIVLKAIRDKIISLIVITMVILVVSSVLVVYISRSISSRLKVIDEAMTLSEKGELVMVAGSLGKDEIGHTANRYNDMIRNTTALIDEVKRGRIKADTLLVEKTKAYEELELLNQEIKVQNSKINDLIYIDALTGLKNRFAISERIDQLLEQTIYPYGIAIIFIDIDNFKDINDTFGHNIGDQVITQTGILISEIESDSIEIGRFGGDEFIITLKSLNLLVDLEDLLKRLEQKFDDALMVNGNKFYLSLSIGVTRFPENGKTKEDLIKKADQALYQAKESGKNQSVIFDETLNKSYEDKIKLQRKIKEATKNKEFHLNYQPYVDSKTKEIKGFEALIRWKPSEGVMISPFELITNAEEMGIIVEIGDWVILEACKFIKQVNMNRVKPMTISINVSTVQLMYKTFPHRLIEIVEGIGVKPELIFLEITETMLLDSIIKGKTIIDQLKTFGFGISLDDFGTGYSSLSYFKELPVTVLKIDKTFIDDVVEDYYNKELIGTIVKIAHNRQVLVTAEGVEEKKQLDYLTLAGVDMIQGYYFSRPLSETDAIKFLENSEK